MEFIVLVNISVSIHSITVEFHYFNHHLSFLVLIKYIYIILLSFIFIHTVVEEERLDRRLLIFAIHEILYYYDGCVYPFHEHELGELILY